MIAHPRLPGPLTRVFLTAITAALLAACSPTVSEIGVDLPLRTVAVTSCEHVAVNGVLRGKPSDPSVAWLEVAPNSLRQEVVWPTGYHGVFRQVGSAIVLEVRDASNKVVIGSSDVVYGACLTATRNTLLLVPPFR